MQFQHPIDLYSQHTLDSLALQVFQTSISIRYRSQVYHGRRRWILLVWGQRTISKACTRWKIFRHDTCLVGRYWIRKYTSPYMSPGFTLNQILVQQSMREVHKPASGVASQASVHNKNEASHLDFLSCQVQILENHGFAPRITSVIRIQRFSLVPPMRPHYRFFRTTMS